MYTRQTMAAIATLLLVGSSCLLQGVRAQACTCKGPKFTEEWWTQVTQVAPYDKAVRPGRATCGDGTKVPPADKIEVQFKLNKFGPVDQKQENLRISGFLRTWWMDPRLAYHNRTGSDPKDIASNCLPTVRAEAYMAKIWRPDLYMPNVEQKTGKVALLVDPNGQVYLTQQVTLTLRCALDFSKLPYDAHHCNLVTASYMNPITELRILARKGAAGEKLSGSSLVVDKGVRSAIWTLFGTEVGSFPGNNTVVTMTGRGSVDPTTRVTSIKQDFDQVIAVIAFKRAKTGFASNFFPVICVVALSYVGFFVKRQVAPARAAISIIAFLIFRTVYQTITNSIPSIAYPVWFLDYLFFSGCLSFFAVVQYGIVQHYLAIEDIATELNNGLQKRIGAVMKMHTACPENISFSVFLKNIQMVMYKVHFSDVIPRTSSTPPSDFRVTTDFSVSNGTQVTVSPLGLTEAFSLGGPSPPRSSAESGLGDELIAKIEGLGVNEADLRVMEFIENEFKKYDADDSDSIDVHEMQRLFHSFGIYLSQTQTENVMAMYLGAKSHDGHCLASQTVIANYGTEGVEISFRDFVGLLCALNTYLPQPTTVGTLEFSRMPSSLRTDVYMRIAFPLILLFQHAYYFLRLDSTYYTAK